MSPKEIWIDEQEKMVAELVEIGLPEGLAYEVVGTCGADVDRRAADTYAAQIDAARDREQDREASPEDALTHDDQLAADREYRATRPMPFNG